MWRNGWSLVAAAVLLAGCANDSPARPEGAPATVTVVASAAGAASGGPAPLASAVRASATASPVDSDGAACARAPSPVPSLDPSASFDVNDPQQRARRALAEQYRPTPITGVVAKDAIPGAEACVRVLRIQFALLTAGSQTAPDRQAVEAALRTAGLRRIIVRPGPIFAASTGAACVHGSFTATGPAFVIGQPAADGSCRL